MPEKYKNKYRIPSARLAGYDYAQEGLYFATICTDCRDAPLGRLTNFFGEIKNGKMILSDAGKIAENYWQEIPSHFPMVNLDEFVVMPNHIHGILEIYYGDMKSVNAPPTVVETRHCLVSTDAFNATDANITTDDRLQKYNGAYPQMSKISPKPGSLSVIIGSFKSITAKTAAKKFPRIGFHWQTRFYDHIIRNEKSLNNIRAYILNNPKNWERDGNNKEDLWM